MLPADSHPDASCTELPRAEHNEGPRGSSVQDSSGRARSELAAKALRHCSLLEVFIVRSGPPLLATALAHTHHTLLQPLAVDDPSDS